MSVDEQEYLIAPWGDDDTETQICTVELPSREFVVQLEVPTYVLERMEQLGEKHDISVTEALGERLELNRARVSLLAARAVEETVQVREHLSEAHELLEGVETLDTADIEAEIDRVWQRELDSV